MLDLGCGPSSPLKNCKNITYSIGVDSYKPYLNISKKSKIHNKYLKANISKINFPANSFDAVILIEVIEHLTKQEGKAILDKANIWARKKIILSTPNGYFPMTNYDRNPKQNHLSGWSRQQLTKLGFTCYGVSGLKFFYHQSNQTTNSLHNNQLTKNIKYRPKILFYLINSLFQIFNYYLPRYSFGLFAIKTKCLNR